MNAVVADITSYTTRDLDAAHSLYLLRASPAVAARKRPALLLHGSTLPGSIAYTIPFGGLSWLDDLAARGVDGWALDVRGYGRSWQPEDDGARPCRPVANTAQATADVASAITFIKNVTGAAAVDLIGWSWGATVAAAYAAGGSEVGRMVLHAPQWLRDTPSPMVNAQSLNEPYRSVDITAFVERWLDRVDPASRETMQGWRETLEKALAAEAPIHVPNGSARDIATQWMAGRPAYDPATITAPTLVVVGAADTDTPPALARTVFDRLGSTEKLYAEIPLGTHFTPFEPARADLFRMTAAFLAANKD